MKSEAAKVYARLTEVIDLVSPSPISSHHKGETIRLLERLRDEEVLRLVHEEATRSHLDPPSPSGLVHYTDHHGGTACSQGPVPNDVKRTEDRTKVTCDECRSRKERGE